MVVPGQKPGRSKQDYETPDEFIQAVCQRFGFSRFDFDLAASMENAKASYWDVDDDSLNLDWSGLAGNLWLNPPFGNITPWVDKAHWHGTGAGARIFMLLPASVGSNWYAEHVDQVALVLALRPRLTFVGAKDPYPKDLILAVYGEWPGFHCWDWKNG